MSIGSPMSFKNTYRIDHESNVNSNRQMSMVVGALWRPFYMISDHDHDANQSKFYVYRNSFVIYVNVSVVNLAAAVA